MQKKLNKVLQKKTQKQVADMIGVSQPAVWLMIKSKRDITLIFDASGKCTHWREVIVRAVP